MIRIALPNKGSLSDEAAILVKSAGYSVRRDAKELSVTDSANDLVALAVLGRVAPELVDKLLYSAEELQILNS